MDFSSKKVLLTGAGFTHNFDAPLASEMRTSIFNNQEIHGHPKIKKLLINNDDYEAVYDSVMNGDYDDLEMSAINNAIKSTYEDIDKIVKDYLNGDVSTFKLQEFIRSIQKANSPKNTFIFTLNQDLFIERHCRRNLDYILELLGPNELTIKSPLDQKRIQDGNFSILPYKHDLDTFQNDVKNIRTYYIKLHGSYIWKSANNHEMMVITGKNKESAIKEEPLLSWYFNIFKKVLSQENVELLIIGYGFGDKHINQVLKEAIEKYNLEIHIICPENQGDFFRNLVDRKLPEVIKNGLRGYYPNDFKQIFPSDENRTECFLNVIKRNFLSENN